MDISIDIAFVTVILLVSIRIAAIFYLTPMFAVGRIPARFQVLFVLAMAATLAAALGVKTKTIPETTPALFAAAIQELLIGSIMAFGVFTAFAAFQLGGRVIDMQMGFGVANLIDPVTHAQSPLLGTVLNLIAVMMFLTIDGHHMIIRGIAFSLEQMPPGMPMRELNPAAIVTQFGAMFVYAIAIVAPVLFTILLLDVGLGVMARTMPQVNIFIVSLPLKIFVGLSLLAISIAYMPPLMKRIFESIFIYWERILG